MARGDGFMADGLQAARGRRGMPIAVLAERANVARGTVYAAEAGKPITLACLIRMALVLEVPLSAVSTDGSRIAEAVA